MTSTGPPARSPDVSAGLPFEAYLDAAVRMDENRDGILIADLHHMTLQRSVVIHRDLFELHPSADEDTPHRDTGRSVAQRIHDEPTSHRLPPVE